MPQFTIRFVARGDEAQLLESERDAVFIGAVVDAVGEVDRPISHVVIGRHAVQGPDEDLIATASILDLPTGPARFEGAWDRVLVHLCGTPEPSLVQEWMDRAGSIVADKALSRVAWFEVTDANEGADHWGELHVTAAKDQQAVDDLVNDPDWIAGQPTLDRLVGKRYQLITRPLLNRLDTLNDGRDPEWPTPPDR